MRAMSQSGVPIVAGELHGVQRVTPSISSVDRGRHGTKQRKLLDSDLRATRVVNLDACCQRFCVDVFLAYRSHVQCVPGN